jgi:ketosteroid isomerase-like protein
MLCLLCTAGSAQAQAPQADDEVRAVVQALGAALAAGDSARVLELLHPAAVIHENGHAETRAQYRGGHLRSDIAFAAATARTTSADDVRIIGDAALYTSRYHVTGRFRDRDIDSRGTETMVLQRTVEGWRIVHIHWSSR